MEYQPSSHGALAYYLQHCAPPAKSKIAAMGSQNVQQVYPYIIGPSKQLSQIIFFSNTTSLRKVDSREKKQGGKNQ